jgi:hypothetical protein
LRYFIVYYEDDTCLIISDWMIFLLKIACFKQVVWHTFDPRKEVHEENDSPRISSGDVLGFPVGIETECKFV